MTAGDDVDTVHLFWGGGVLVQVSNIMLAWTFSQPEKKNNLEKIKWMNKAIALKNPCIFTCDLL